jgi:hypothetical protein
MANFFELLGFDSNDMADAMPEKIVQVGLPQWSAAFMTVEQLQVAVGCRHMACMTLVMLSNRI